jgi:Fur family ferric uptake transcriptional regulator
MKAQRTRSQDRILNLLKTMNRAVSAQDIYVELRNRDQSMGLATVYRSLEALKLEGVVQVRTLASGESLYSSVQQDKHHLTCLQCGDSIPINECQFIIWRRSCNSRTPLRFFTTRWSFWTMRSLLYRSCC